MNNDNNLNQNANLNQQDININQQGNIDNRNNKIIIHGHTEKDNSGDFPIRIYEGENLIVELQRLGTFEFNLNRDTTLTFRYCLYQPINYTFKCNQDEEIFLSLDMNWQKINIKSNLDNQAKTIENNNSVNNEPIVNIQREKNKHPVLSTIIVLLMIWFIYGLYYVSTPMDESKACIAVKDYIKEQMKNPSSAEFSDDCTVTKESSNDKLWYIRGTVRGTNSYGGVVAQQYTVFMKVDDNNYQIEGVKFD